MKMLKICYGGGSKSGSQAVTPYLPSTDVGFKDAANLLAKLATAMAARSRSLMRQFSYRSACTRHGSREHQDDT